MGHPDSNPADEPADDLFGRWLAHRQGTGASDEKAAPSPVAAPAREPEAAAAGRASSRITTVPSFGEDRPDRIAPGPSTREVPELDRVPPPGFEPVLLRSVRKKAEAAQSEGGKDGRRRFGLTRPRPAPVHADDDPPTESPAPGALAESTPEPPQPAREQPIEAVEQPGPTALAVEDVIAAAMAARPTPAPAPRSQVHAETEPRASAAPLEPGVAPDPEPDVEPVLPEPEPEPLAPEPAPAPRVREEPVEASKAARPGLSVEDVIAAALAAGPSPAAVPPRDEPAADPLVVEPQLGTRPEPRSEAVVGEPAPVPASASEAWRSFTEPVEPLERLHPDDGASADEHDPAPVSRLRSLGLRRSESRTKQREDRDPPPKRRPAANHRDPRSTDEPTWEARRTREPNAVRTMIATVRERADTNPVPTVPTLETEAAAEIESPVPAPDQTSAPVSKYAPLPPTAPQMPAHYEFATLRSARRVLNVLLLSGLATTCWLAYTYYTTGSDVAKGLTAIAGLATLLIWATRAGFSPARLTIDNGLLEVRKQGSRFVFDLASTYTPIKVVGHPGKRGWKVLFLRRGMRAFVVDASMVDPHEFMRALRYFRPEFPKRG